VKWKFGSDWMEECERKEKYEFSSIDKRGLNYEKHKKISKMHNLDQNTTKNKEDGRNRATIRNLGARKLS
jgi:hypothetical protein